MTLCSRSDACAAFFAERWNRNGAALHINDWVVPVLSNRRSGQTQNILCFDLAKDSFKSHGGQMMALVHDDVAIVGDEIFDISFAVQTLDHGNINHAGSLDLSASNVTDFFQSAYPGRQPIAHATGPLAGAGVPGSMH